MNCLAKVFIPRGASNIYGHTIEKEPSRVSGFPTKWSHGHIPRAGRADDISGQNLVASSTGMSELSNATRCAQQQAKSKRAAATCDRAWPRSRPNASALRGTERATRDRDAATGRPRSHPTAQRGRWRCLFLGWELWIWVGREIGLLWNVTREVSDRDLPRSFRAPLIHRR